MWEVRVNSNYGTIPYIFCPKYAKVTTHLQRCCVRELSRECCPAVFGKALLCLQGISFNTSFTPRHLQPSWFSPGPLGAGWKQPPPLGHFSTGRALETWEGCGRRKECGPVPTLGRSNRCNSSFSPSQLSLSLCSSPSQDQSVLSFIGRTLKTIIAGTSR